MELLFGTDERREELVERCRDPGHFGRARDGSVYSMNLRLPTAAEVLHRAAKVRGRRPGDRAPPGFGAIRTPVAGDGERSGDGRSLIGRAVGEGARGGALEERSVGDVEQARERVDRTIDDEFLPGERARVVGDLGLEAEGLEAADELLRALLAGVGERRDARDSAARVADAALGFERRALGRAREEDAVRSERRERLRAAEAVSERDDGDAVFEPSQPLDDRGVGVGLDGDEEKTR